MDKSIFHLQLIHSFEQIVEILQRHFHTHMTLIYPTLIHDYALQEND